MGRGADRAGVDVLLGALLGHQARRLSARPGPTAGGERGARARGERGSAVVDFALVGGLVALLLAGLLQLGVVLHVRNTLVDCVGEGARFGALADRTPGDGADRARALITESLPAGYAGQVTATTERTAAGDEVEVTARAPLPVAGLLGGPAVLVVHGHGAVQALPDAAP